MEFSSQRRETLLFLITIIYFNLRSGPILGASIHSFLLGRAIIGLSFGFAFHAGILLKRRNNKEPDLRLNLLLIADVKQRKQNILNNEPNPDHTSIKQTKRINTGDEP